MKIAVMGFSGAGKSTLARELGRRYGCPVLHLDKVQFTPGWQERDRGEMRELVARFMEHDAWVIDGNYSKFCLERRLKEADRIIFLNLPRLACFWRAWRRYRRFRGRTREDMAEGCPEKFDWEFMWWILWKGRTRSKKEQFQHAMDGHWEKTTVLCSQKQIDAYLEGLSC